MTASFEVGVVVINPSVDSWEDGPQSIDLGVVMHDDGEKPAQKGRAQHNMDANYERGRAVERFLQ